MIFAACDQIYFDLFAVSFFHTFKDQGNVHIHIVNPNEESITTTIKEISDDRLSISTEIQNGELGSPFYASLRFLRAGEIIKHLKKNLIILDIDICGHVGFSKYLEAADKGDVSICEITTIVPWLKHMAGLLYVKNSPFGLQYLDLLGKTLAEALENPSWFIDQSILHSVNMYFDQKTDSKNINYIKESDGFYIPDMLIPTADFDEKTKLRSKTNLGGYGYS